VPPHGFSYLGHSWNRFLRFVRYWGYCSLLFVGAFFFFPSFCFCCWSSPTNADPGVTTGLFLETAVGLAQMVGFLAPALVTSLLLFSVTAGSFTPPRIVGPGFAPRTLCRGLCQRSWPFPRLVRIERGWCGAASTPVPGRVFLHDSSRSCRLRPAARSAAETPFPIESPPPPVSFLYRKALFPAFPPACKPAKGSCPALPGVLFFLLSTQDPLSQSGAFFSVRLLGPLTRSVVHAFPTTQAVHVSAFPGSGFPLHTRALHRRIAARTSLLGPRAFHSLSCLFPPHPDLRSYPEYQLIHEIPTSKRFGFSLPATVAGDTPPLWGGSLL